MDKMEGRAKILPERELIDLMLKYSDMSAELEEIEEQIRTQVLLRGESYKIANLEARYYKQSTRTDYKSAALAHLGDDLEPLDIFRKPPQYDYRAFCTQHELDLEPFKSIGSAPRVVLRFK